MWDTLDRQREDILNIIVACTLRSVRGQIVCYFKDERTEMSSSVVVTCEIDIISNGVNR